MVKIKKNIIFVFILIIIVALTCNTVFAAEVEASCDGLLTVEAADLLKEIIGYMQIGVPVLLIIFGGVDLGQAVISEDKDALKKGASRFLKRCIAGVIIFFIPFIVSLVLNLPGIKGEVNLVDDPLCGITK